jgi:hypothetical protein
MRSKLRIGLAGVLVIAATCAFAAVPGHATARVALHQVAASPDTGFNNDSLCDFEFENPGGLTLCMSGYDGNDGPVNGVSSGDHEHLDMDEGVDSDCGGTVQDGAKGQGAPCPFADGSGLNTHFDGKSIVQLLNHQNGMNYAASGSGPANWGVIEENGGNGQLWVQVGDLTLGEAGASFVNVYASDREGTPAIICADGNGNQLEAVFYTGTLPVPGMGSACNWENVGN